MAKFKKGDRVVATEPNYHTRGIGVVRGYEYSWDEEIERDDPGWYIVDFPNQYKVKMGKGSLRAANAARSRNAYAVDKKGRPIKSGMMLKDDDGDKFYVGRVLRGNVVEDEWGNQRLETNRWAEIVQNSIRSRNAVVQKALNATGDKRDYYVVDEFGNAADGSKTPLPFDKASELFLELTGSKSGNGKWGIIRRGEPASRARDWYGNIVSWNADTSVLRETAVNAARSTNAVVAKALNAQAVCNAGDPGHFTSDELSALKSAFAGLNGASFSQYPNKSREQLAVRGENGILITVQKYAFDGKPVEFDIRGQGPRSGFGVKFASSIREAVTTVKRMLASAKRQSPYSFSKYD